MDWQLKFSDKEIIVSAIYGVLGVPQEVTISINFRFSKKDQSKNWPLWGSEPLPSNALFFTNKRIFVMFIETESVPMSILTFRKKSPSIRRDKTQLKGDEMIATMSPEEILREDANNFAILFDEIDEVNLRKRKDEGSWGDSFTIKTTDKKKYRYQFLNKTDIPKLEKTLKELLFAKAIIESGKLIR